MASSNRLRAGGIMSCGCSRKGSKSALKHGHTRDGQWSRAYAVYAGMKWRCLSPNSKDYKYYGGRGIGICDKWLQSFEEFFEDMGEPPPGKSLDRVDNDKGYSPENCRWASREEQIRNRRNTVYVSYRGEQLTISDLARLASLPVGRIRQRIARGMSAEKAVEAG